MMAGVQVADGCSLHRAKQLLDLNCEPLQEPNAT